MTFILALLSLLIERFFHWGHLRAWRWLTPYQRAWQNMPGVRSPALLLLFSVSLVLIVVGVCQHLLVGRFYNFPVLLLDLVALLYCLGPANLWVDFAAVSPEHDKARVDRSLFLIAHERLFAVLFWFCLLGPLGAVLYRMTALSADNDAPFTLPALTARRWLDWLPIRIFVLLCALAGHFSAVLAAFKKHALADISANDILLMECGAAALSLTAEPPGDTPDESGQALALLDRVFIIGLVFLALVVLIISG